MNIIYTGRQDQIPPQQREKLETRLSKIGKLLEGRKGEKEAHVILRHERHLHNVEITVNAFDQGLVCVGEAVELGTALTQAMEKLEKQVVRLREKVRDSQRHHAPRESGAAGQTTTPRETPAVRTGPRIHRVEDTDGRKPITVDEAVLEMEGSDTEQYLVFRNADTDRVSVLLRRPDGNYDLVEG